MRNIRSCVAAASVAILGVAGAAWTAPGTVRDSSTMQILRGRYLVAAGDCAACHTAEGGRPFAGGRPVPTPFGTIYSTNITPDADRGIGRWSNDDFWKAMHDGIRRDGKHLYPAFPYPWYTKLDHDDVLAIKAYLDTLEPVRNAARAPDLPWPLSWRGSVAGWNALFFNGGTYAVNPNRSAEWNRGAYLVEGLGHCGACHSPKNILGGTKKDRPFQGGMGEGWFATNVTGSPYAGVGSWGIDEIVDYLKTGANDRARAYGPMAEVVEHSTSHLDPADLRAIAAFLKDVPYPANETAQAKADVDKTTLARGRRVYLDQCAACHMENGEGIPGVFPSLHANSAIRAEDPHSLVRLILDGASSVKTRARPEGFGMPAFAGKLRDSEIADLLSYLRANFDNEAPPISASRVGDVRKAVESGAS